MFTCLTPPKSVVGVFRCFLRKLFGWPYWLMLFLLFLCAKQTAFAQTTRYVTTSGTNTNPSTATSWANASGDLQAVINASAAGDKIFVAKGTYKPERRADAVTAAKTPNNRNNAFVLKDGVKIYGGFAGTETGDETTRTNIRTTNKTILSGDLDNTNTHSNGDAHHVVVSVKNGKTTVLDGFTIIRGYANSNGHITVEGVDIHRIRGAGMYNHSSSPTITNTTFSENRAVIYGGGMFNDNSSSPTISNTTFNNNSAPTGGGMCNNSSSPSINNSTFSNNSAASGGGMSNNSSSPSINNAAFGNNSATNGGGMSNYSSSPTVTNTTFGNNTATINGGGMFNDNSSSPTISNTTFSNNSAPTGGGMCNNSSSPSINNSTFSNNSTPTGGNGGGMYNHSSSPSITNTTFSENRAKVNGGGMYNNNSSSPSITNTTFRENKGDWGGGGMYNNSSSPNISKSAFTRNESRFFSHARGGGMYNNSSSPTITNTTFESNRAGFGGGMYNSDNSSPTISNTTFSNNSAPTGGGMCNNSSSPTITNTTFGNNKATTSGGGMYNNSSSPTISNTIFSFNQSTKGGGMYNDHSSPTITNTTFKENRTLMYGGAIIDGGGAIYNQSSSPKIYNSIFWANKKSAASINTAGVDIENSSSTPTVAHSLLQLAKTTYPTTGVNRFIFANTDKNIYNQNPKFSWGLGLGLGLQTGSPAINAGDNSKYNTTTMGNTDLVGNPRILYTTIDMGAHEYQKTPATITFADLSKTYGSPDFNLAATTNSSGTITYSIVGTPNGTALSGTNNETVSLGNIGTVTIRASVAATASHTAATKDITLTIDKKPLTGITFPDSTLVYDGTAKSLKISGSLPAGVSVSYSGNGKIGAGVYTVVARINGGSIYKSRTLRATLRITPASITGLSFANGTFRFDGSPKSLAISGNLPSGTNVSYIGNGKTNAGVYEVTARINGGGNYQTRTLKARLTIEKASIAGLSFADSVFRFDGSPKSLAISGNLPSGTNVSYIGNEKIDAGIYEVVAQIDGGGNYRHKTLKAQLTIEKASIAGLSFADSVFRFDGSPKSLAISGDLPSGTNIKYTNNGKTDAGIYEVAAQIEGGKNYLSDTLKAQLTIEKASIAGLSFADSVFRFDGSAKSLAISGDLPTGASVNYTGNGKTDAGVYEVIAQIEGGRNYQPKTLKAKLTIEKSAITGVSFPDSVFRFDGSAKSLAISGDLPSGATVRYIGNGKTDAGIYEVVAQIEGGKNYQSKTLKAKLTIEKAAISEISFLSKTVVYDGKTHRLAVNLANLPSGTNVSYVGNEKTDAGIYEVIAQIDGGINYHSETLKAKLTIEKAVITGLSFADSVFRFDGSAKSLAISGNLPSGATIRYIGNGKTDAGVYEVVAQIEGGRNYQSETLKAKLTIEKAAMPEISFLSKTVVYNGKTHALSIAPTALPKGASVSYIGNGKIDAGIYEVIAQIEGGRNYQPKTLKAQLTIEKAKITDISLPDESFVYDGAAKSLKVSGDLPAGVSVNYSGNGKTDAGIYEVIAQIEGGKNYQPKTLKAQLTIEKATQTLTWTQDIDNCSDEISFRLTAQSNSGLPVTYASSDANVAKVSGDDLQILKRAAFGLTATQAGDKNHRAAEPMTKNFAQKLFSLVSKHWEDALFFDNSSRQFTAWQWYKNGELVAGASKQYYHESTALDGIYHAKVTDVSGAVRETCPLKVVPGKKPGGIVLSPNPVSPETEFVLEANYPATELEGAKVQIISVGGRFSETKSIGQVSTTLNAPPVSGLYIVRLLLRNGKRASGNLLVR